MKIEENVSHCYILGVQGIQKQKKSFTPKKPARVR